MNCTVCMLQDLIQFKHFSGAGCHCEHYISSGQASVSNALKNRINGSHSVLQHARHSQLTCSRTCRRNYGEGPGERAEEEVGEEPEAATGEAASVDGDHSDLRDTVNDGRAVDDGDLRRCLDK